MTRMTLLRVAQWIELVLGAYFVAALILWLSRLNPSMELPEYFFGTLFVRGILAVVFLILYFRTRDKLKELGNPRHADPNPRLVSE
jgi:hypothetical protein